MQKPFPHGPYSMYSIKIQQAEWVVQASVNRKKGRHPLSCGVSKQFTSMIQHATQQEKERGHYNGVITSAEFDYREMTSGAYHRHPGFLPLMHTRLVCNAGNLPF
ncbi:hypothetical protein TNCV_3821311 [Trichonephila clavipes]|nr:hypothetical protein TNCV_3821311 [Trichonephila clavipes]